MAGNTNLTAKDAGDTVVSAIENELPAYRAISPAAIVSLVLGLVSGLSFANQYFLIASIAAVVLGVLATRKIERFNDVLTGVGYARAGIALGLIFGLASFTTEFMSDFLYRREAAKFARQYVEALKRGQLEDVLALELDPETRKERTPSDLLKEMKSKQPNVDAFEMRTMSTRSLKKRVDAIGADAVKFSKIENVIIDGFSIRAGALLDLQAPPTKTEGVDQNHALIVMLGHKDGAKFEWQVESVIYPYRLASYVPAAKPADDGHGH